MKTILVPTDYSDSANNALDYAIELAKISKAKLLLMHVYHVPVPSNEMVVMVVSSDELEKENKLAIQKLEKEVREKVANAIEVESLVCEGFAVDEIVRVIEERKPDWVLMGITGMSKIGEALIGSITTSVISKTTTPVIAIPQEAKFKEIKKIVFACNYEEKVNPMVVNRFKEFLSLFNAKVMVLDVVREKETATYKKALAGIDLEHSFSDIDHTLHFPSANDISSEINVFVDREQADLLVMVPQSHKSIAGIFHRSNTKRMAFHTHVPLLSLHN